MNICHISILVKIQYTLPHTIITHLNPQSSNASTNVWRPKRKISSSSSSSSSSLHRNSIWPHRQSHTSLELEKYDEVVMSVVLQPQGVFFHELFFFPILFLNINKFNFFFFFFGCQPLNLV